MDKKDSINCNIIARMHIEAINHISLHYDGGLGSTEYLDIFCEKLNVVKSVKQRAEITALLLLANGPLNSVDGPFKFHYEICARPQILMT